MILLLCSAAFAFSWGRRTEPPPAPPPPEPVVQPAPVPPAWQASPGSLYSPTQASLVTGMTGTARRVGDLITVIVEENMQSQVDASTNTSAAGDTAFGVRSAFGLDVQALDANPSMGTEISLGLGKTTSHNGTGTVSRGNAIAAIVTCKIIAVLPNGNLLLRGDKQLTVNGEDQFITLTGEAQSRDISSDNTVSSTRLADPHFESVGRGVVGDKQKVGWGQRIIDTIAP